jgi:hypothetical protein
VTLRLLTAGLRPRVLGSSTPTARKLLRDPSKWVRETHQTKSQARILTVKGSALSLGLGSSQECRWIDLSTLHFSFRRHIHMHAKHMHIY